MSKEIEKYLEQNNIAYNRAIKNDLGEYISIGDLINNYTKALLDKIEVLEMANKDTVDSYNIIVHELKGQIAQNRRYLQVLRYCYY